MAVITVTNRLIDITVSGGDTEVKFDRSYQRFALKSEDALSLKDAENEYKTSDGNGVARMNFGVGTDTITVSGSGTGRLWAGMSFDDCPFVNAGKGGGSSFIGVTTTAITDGSTTSPITIDGKSVTPKMGDVVIYNQTEFVWDGSKWNQFGNPVNDVGQKYYVSGVAKGEIFNNYSGSSANVASGGSSHAEGSGTTASGYHSHAEGYGTKATNIYAHAEGWLSEASERAAHAEGYETKATAYYSHAEGEASKATSSHAHAEGQKTTASNVCSHSEGYYTTAAGAYSHSEGERATANAQASHAEGKSTVASGSYSHAEGYGTTTTGDASHVGGKYNDYQTGDLFEIGNGTGDNNRSNIVEVSETYLNVNGDLKKNGVPLGSLSMQSSASGSYTPAGSVAVTPTTSSISAVATVGTLPSMIYDSANESITFDPGTLPTISSETVMTGASAAFTGTAGTVTVS